MQVAAAMGEHGDMRVTRKRLAPVFSAWMASTGQPAAHRTGGTSAAGDRAPRRSSYDEAGHVPSPVGDGGRGLGP